VPVYALDDTAPQLPDEGSYWIAPDAVIIGKVRLAPDTGVWFGAVLRGDNELIDIGEGSNIQDRCVLHTDPGSPLTVGAGCTVGHAAILHGCNVGANSLIGMGAVILNGATIGRNCIIGAHALVPEGKVIPDNSLVIGSPGRVARELSAEQIAMITVSAVNYRRNWRRYATGLASAGAKD
jgi:carbonic anhydrase/acetyltransferase-like protein (isoleucine patch superfamily)